jgi:transcriptional regulator with XRE-family HTH domain
MQLFFGQNRLSIGINCSFILHTMSARSKRKTTVAVLRQLLELSVEQLAKLIGKSPTTINSLETGRLKLSEETAFKITQQTGVEMVWLLQGRSKDKPYIFDESMGEERSYTKADYEIAQARKHTPPPSKVDPDRLILNGLGSVLNWLPIYAKAQQDGKGYLAHYLMYQCLAQLRERLGQDQRAVLRANKNTRLIANDGSKWFISSYAPGHLTWFPEKPDQLPKVKTSLSQPSPANAHRASDRKSASPKRRRRDVQASG